MSEYEVSRLKEDLMMKKKRKSRIRKNIKRS